MSEPPEYPSYGSPSEPVVPGPRPTPGHRQYVPPPGPVSGGGLGLAERIGPRLPRRPEPRFGVTLAAVGVGLAVVGVAVIGGQSGGDGSVSGGRKAIGVVLALALVAAGYGLLWIRRNGPLSTTGVAASALGVPLLLAFACSAADLGSSATTNIVALVSLVAWLASYIVVPGAQGHVFYLGAFAVTLWFYVLDKVEPNLLAAVVLLPFAGLRVTTFGEDTSGFGFTPYPDFTVVATVSILFGVGYYVGAVLLDRAGHSGPAVAFVVAGLPATVLGLAVAAVRTPQAAEGILIIVVSAALGLVGARTGRRFTTWFWTAGVGVGIVVVLEDVVTDHDTAAGISLIVLGALVVVLAQFVTSVLREPDETVPTPPRGAGTPH